MTVPEEAPFDILIVGGGTAGCVLAARLSELPLLRVLLVEAGPDSPPGHEPADLRDPYPLALGNPAYSWPRVAAEPTASLGAPSPAPRPFLQGYGIGGSSNIQGMIAFRGQPADYDAWHDGGARGWGWQSVLPYFRKLERDLDFTGPLHGADGPIPVRRIRPTEWAPLARAVAAALQRQGFPLIEDYNADFSDGVSPLPMANLPGQRVSASMAYLSNPVRRRANLTVRAGVLAERLVIQDGRVRGVRLRTASGSQVIMARDTIVSCGALFSPALLMRSGIGPAEKLRALGLDVIRDLPGVGRNLQNHPKIELAFHLPLRSVQPRGQRGFGQNCLRYSSKHEDCDAHDLGVVIINRAAWHPLGRRVGALGIALYKPYSTGRIELASTDPATPPRVHFNALSDPRDLRRLTAGLRLACELLGDPEVAAARNEVFIPDGRMVMRLSRKRLQAFVEAAGIAAALDVPPLRRALLRRSTLAVQELARDEAALRAIVARRAGVSHHACGTCRMGRVGDPDAVVDNACRVRGVKAMRVVDAAIFPTIVRGNTHLPVLMVAEKMADQIKSELQGGART
jgi:5-(hydroxymethyl)furfural/furfural oxidase